MGTSVPASNQAYGTSPTIRSVGICVTVLKGM